MNKLHAWKPQSLSLAGRLTLSKSMINPILTYAMQSSHLLISICKEIDKLNHNFLWGSTAESKKIP